MDIIAEQVSDSAEIRKRIREIAQNNGVLRSVAADEEKESVYTMYYDFGETVKKIAGSSTRSVRSLLSTACSTRAEIRSAPIFSAPPERTPTAA